MLKAITKGAICAVSALLIVSAAQQANAQTVAISTLPPGAINNVQAAAIAKAVQENSDLQMRLITFNSPAAIIAAVQNKQAEFAYTSNEEAGDSFNGTNEYKGKAMKDLRVAFTVFPFKVGIIVRNKSDIKTVADMKGKRVGTEWTGFRQGIALWDGLLGNAGLSLKDVDPVPTTDLLRAADDFKAGKSDAFMFAVGGPKVAEAHASIEGGVRFLNMDPSPEAVKRMQAVRHEYHVAPQQPAPHLAGVIGPTNLMQYYIVVLTNKDAKDDLVYKMVKTAHANKAAMVAGHPSFNAFTQAGMAVPHDRLEYHPGAIKFYKEAGIWKGK
ncbi:MAG TPA: TAXI family TRAP transporter solute-binding subunit [Xanthobacteraceae bacterium]|nr:TAXI family TRAP transporter solute-binding subunit [Xanthobacteraceae bacterium]